MTPEAWTRRRAGSREAIAGSLQVHTNERPWQFAGAVFFATIDQGKSPLLQHCPQAREGG
jgi:hypothetical protein